MNKFLAGGLLTVILATGITTAAFDTDTASADDHSTTEAHQDHIPHREHDEDFKDEITKTVELTDTGAIITMTTENDQVLEKMFEKHENMQERFSDEPGDHPMADKINHTMTILDNGVQMEISVTDATDTELIEKIQEKAENGPGFGPGFHGGKGGPGSKGHGGNGPGFGGQAEDAQ